MPSMAPLPYRYELREPVEVSSDILLLHARSVTGAQTRVEAPQAAVTRNVWLVAERAPSTMIRYGPGAAPGSWATVLPLARQVANVGSNGREPSRMEMSRSVPGDNPEMPNAMSCVTGLSNRK